MKVRGRGACSPYPDMPNVNCKTEPQLSNVENCPDNCHLGCTNGYCDCETGECLCNPGFAGPNCSIDTCTVAGCVNGNCAAKYLGGELPVTNKPCVCIDGWYGDKCDTTIPPLTPEYTPECFNNYFYFQDTNIAGAYLDIIYTSDPKTCSQVCNLNKACNSFVITGVCYLKSGIQRVVQAGVATGIKCSIDIDAVITPPTNPPIIINPDYIPTCEKDNYNFYPDTDIVGGNLEVIQTTDAKLCCVACDANPLCKSWVTFGSCYLKSGTQIAAKAGVSSGIKCSFDGLTNIPLPTNAPTSINPDYIPNCEQDNYNFYPDTDIVGGNLEHIITKDKKVCLNSCNANRYCKSWVLFDACYLKSGTQRVAKVGLSSGIKCSVQQNPCDGFCRGDYPYGCATTFSHSYCNNVGGCYYLPITNNDPNFCCFQNC